MFKQTQLALSIFLALSVAACGGGGGGTSSTPTTPTVSTKIGGAAVKGIIKNGVVTAYELDASGSKKQQVGTATTNASGAYELTLSSSYTGGALLIELSKGSGSKMVCDALAGCNGTAYGAEMDLPDGFNMTAIAPPASAGSTVKTQVTPFSHMAAKAAVKEMSDGKAPAEAVMSAVTQINSIVGVDILTTQPVDITNSDAVRDSTPEQQQYALFNAAFADVIAGGNMQTVLDNYAAEFEDGDFDAGNANVNLNTLIEKLDDQVNSDKNSGLNEKTKTDVTSVVAVLDQVVGADGSYNPESGDSSGQTAIAQAKTLVQDARTWMSSLSSLESPAEAFAVEAEAVAKTLSYDSGAVLEASIGVVSEQINVMLNKLKAGEFIPPSGTILNPTIAYTLQTSPTVAVTLSTNGFKGMKFDYTVTFDKPLSALQGNGAGQTITGKIVGTASNPGIAATLDATLTMAINAIATPDHTIMDAVALNGSIKLAAPKGEEVAGAVLIDFVSRKSAGVSLWANEGAFSQLSLSRFKLGDMTVKTAAGSSAGFAADLKIDNAATFDALSFLEGNGHVWVEKCFAGDAAGFTALANAAGITTLWDQHYSPQGIWWAPGITTVLNGTPLNGYGMPTHVENNSVPARAASTIASAYQPLPPFATATVIRSDIRYQGPTSPYRWGNCDTEVKVLLDLQSQETAASFMDATLTLTGKLALAGRPEATAAVTFDRTGKNTATASVLLAYNGQMLDIDVNRAANGNSGTLEVSNSSGTKLSVGVAAGTTSGTVKVGDVTVGTISNGILRYTDGTFESLN